MDAKNLQEFKKQLCKVVEEEFTEVYAAQKYQPWLRRSFSHKLLKTERTFVGSISAGWTDFTLFSKHVLLISVSDSLQG